MQERAKILLVAIGSDPTNLVEQLAKLEVEVREAALVDAEEQIDDWSPDLIVLHGARGALELATLVEGNETDHPPRMVIAAERRELARLRGLNRDVVISLFALETGPPVVAQRVESLARRAARRRRNSQPPPANQKKTALGLPTAERLDRGAPEPATSVESTSQTQSPASPPEALDAAPRQQPAEPSPKEARAPADETESSRSNGPHPGADEASAKSPPLTPSLLVPPTDGALVEVADEDLHSLREPRNSETFSDSAPTLRPQLESSPSAQGDPAELPIRSPEATSDETPQRPGLSEFEEREHAPQPESSPPPDSTSQQTIPVPADVHPLQALDEAAPSESFEEAQRVAAEGKDAAQSTQSSGAGLLVLLTATAVVVAAAAAVASGLVPWEGSLKKDKALALAPSSPKTAAEASRAAPLAAQGDATTSREKPSDVAEVEQKAADRLTETEADQPASPAAEKATDASIGGLEEAFRLQEEASPSCVELLSNRQPSPGPDPITDASLVWAEARKLVVAGKLDAAHGKMCEAVSLYSESAAVEGLAHLYLDLQSPQRALEWVHRANELRPGQLEMGYLMGDIQSLQGKVEASRTTWLRTLNLSETDSARISAISRDYSVEAGRALRRGALLKAERWYRRAVTLDRGNLPGLLGLAKTFYRRELPTRAKAIALEALKTSDLIPELHVLLGDIALKEGDKNGARARYERALQTRPGFFPAERGLSQAQ